MDYRCRLPGALYRRASQRATSEGVDLSTVIRRLLTQYTDGASGAASLGARGGKASAAALSPDERAQRARHAAVTRWSRSRIA